MSSYHIILLYSKYSNFSKNFFNIMNQTDVLKNIQIKLLCVDNEKLRERILNSKNIKINNIPCILIMYDNGTVDKYEGTDCFLWLDDFIEKTQKTQLSIKKLPQQVNIQQSHLQPSQPPPKIIKTQKQESKKVTSVDDIETDDEEDDDNELLADVNLIRLERENYDKQNIVQVEQKNERNYDQKSNRKSDIKKNNLNKFVEEMQKNREIEEKNLPRPPIDSLKR